MMNTLSFHSFKILSLFLFMFAATISSQNAICPFQFLYQFGDGITDIGNSIRVLPLGPLLPATRYPYGETYPGRPYGRWSDGLINVDYAAQVIGLPYLKQYLQLDFSTSYDGVVFSVEGSTVLNSSFFQSRGISIPPYNIPLSTQINWQPPNALTRFVFSEANDLGYALVQGKSIAEVQSYVPLLIQAQINAAREVIQLGATRLIYAFAAPLGCYPYILTALFTNDPTAYDQKGCLRAVNDLVVAMNSQLQTAFNSLKAEFPTVTILNDDFYTVATAVINQTSVVGSTVNPALRSCCGIGGRYNYDVNRFCGSLSVPVCPDPNNYVYWDGQHFTQEAYRRMVNMLLPPALQMLNCTAA